MDDNHQAVKTYNDAEVLTQLTMAAQTGRWFVMVAHVDAEGEMPGPLCKTNKFPTSQLSHVAHAFRRFLHQVEGEAELCDKAADAQMAFGTLAALMDVAEEGGGITKERAIELSRSLSDISLFVDQVVATGTKKAPPALPEPETPAIYKPPEEN